MSARTPRVAVVDSLNLLGKELRERFDRHEASLLTTNPEEAGTLTELAGGAAVMTLLGEDNRIGFEDFDLLYLCGTPEAALAQASQRRAGATAIVVTPGLPAGSQPSNGVPVVADVNEHRAEPGSLLLNPPPGAVLVARLLHALAPLGPVAASATVLQSASNWGEPGLQELFEQSRAALSFGSQPEDSPFGQRLAFDVFLEPDGGDLASGHIAAVLEGQLPVAVQNLLAGIFHGTCASLAIEFPEEIAPDTLLDTLVAHPTIEAFNPDEGSLGAIASAQGDAFLVARPRVDTRDRRRIWLWATADNLTRCGAMNALAAGRAAVG